MSRCPPSGIPETDGANNKMELSLSAIDDSITRRTTCNVTRVGKWLALAPRVPLRQSDPGEVGDSTHDDGALATDDREVR